MIMIRLIQLFCEKLTVKAVKNDDQIVYISCSNQSMLLQGEHLVCKRPAASEEGEQDDLGTKEQARRRRCRRL